LVRVLLSVRLPCILFVARRRPLGLLDRLICCSFPHLPLCLNPGTGTGDVTLFDYSGG